ncbi:MAG: hypothetical protein JSS66_12465 [Armatimonadetes bacterium]|nr:hypothetical protein [Armatimonadota bacterium]
MTALRVLGVALALWAACVWHQSFLGQTLLLGQRPDLVLVIVVLTALHTRPAVGALTGFVGGLLLGASAGADMTALTATRAVIGFAVSFVAKTGFQTIPITVGLVTAAATLVAQVALLFMAPPPDIGRFLAATMGTAIYNGVVAGLLDALLRRIVNSEVD